MDLVAELDGTGAVVARFVYARERAGVPMSVGAVALSVIAIGVGIAAFLLPTRMNRIATKITRAAKRRVRERLADRSPASIDDILDGSLVKSSSRGDAVDLLARVGAVLGVDPAVLRADDRLGALLEVRAEEMPSITSSEWRSAGLHGRVVVHIYDIVHIISRYSDRRRWNEKWRSLEDPPESEEESIDLILAMTIRDFLEFFAPLAKKRP